MKKCRVCGREYSNWAFCLECGSVNHDYKPVDYVKSEDIGK